MNCPICQHELDSSIDSTLNEFLNLRCPIYQDDKHNNTHYYKYVIGNSIRHDDIEEISLYPFRIKNIVKSYYEFTSLRKDGEDVEKVPARKEILCYLFKFNPDKYNQAGLHGGGFDKILQLSEHIKAESEDKLRERLKLILIFS